ncbi:MAG: ABC transporter substrate-binding protein [Acidimicrobiales bacterium]|nr:ABC transporter substrate-binding protein [Acidimicrobiales bacterium]
MRRAWLSLLAILLFAAACAGERPSFEDGAAREVPSDADGEVAAADPIRVRLAVPDGWSLDPAEASPASVTNRVLADLLYEGLPILADNWFVSDDRTVWTFVLPAGLVDGEGVVVTARDVKHSLERVAARGPADQSALSLMAITGWHERMTGAAGGVAGISAPDASTLVIRLDAPFEPLIDVLASPAFGVTGTGDNGLLRTTGAYRRTDDPALLVARDDGAAVAEIELVTHPDGPGGALGAGDADWAVLADGTSSVGLDADIVRQPLWLQLALVARHADRAERLGVLGALEPLLLAGEVPGLTARLAPAASESGTESTSVAIDVPRGELQALARLAADQFEAAGATVEIVASDPTVFAARVSTGEATLFPIVLASGADGSLGVLQLATPGGADDAFGPESEARAALAAAIAAESDPAQRALFIEALEQALIEDGLLLPIGRYEVRVAIGRRLDGLRHRADGTLDLSRVALTAEG